MDQETAWAWLGDVYARFKTWERASLNATVVNARAVQAKAEDMRIAAHEGALAAKAGFDAQVKQVERFATDSVFSACSAYPEAVVGGVTVSASLLMRGAPKRTMLTCLCASAALRSKLADKWGDDLARANKQASSFCQSRAEAMGLLLKK